MRKIIPYIFLIFGTSLTIGFLMWTSNIYYLLGEVMVAVIFFGLLRFTKEL